MLRKTTAAAVTMAAAAMAGCAVVPPPLPPSTAYTRTDCATAPDLAAPISLTAPKEMPAFTVATPVNAATPCLMHGGKPGPYVVYVLPAEHADKTVTVGATLEVARVLSPAVFILDDAGQVTRTFAAADFYYRGPLYSVLFRPRETERYVVVTSDPSRIGQRYDSIQIGVGSVYLGNGGSYRFGSEASQSRAFSYEGAVEVLVNDSDTAKKKPVS